VGEIHVAGFDLDPNIGTDLLIDSHASDVDEAVWNLLTLALDRFGPKPVLLERDDKLPAFSSLLAERQVAEGMIEQVSANRPVSMKEGCLA
jgi:uncharacterized protein (UPF0276 family)